MLKIVGLVLAALILIPAAWLGSAIAYETWHTYTHRFRLTLEVDTPEGVKSGSSVIEVAIRKKADWVPQSGGFAPHVKGEAVFVDLGRGRQVVAVLAQGPTASNINIYSLAGQAFGRTFPDWYREAPSWSGRTELERDLVPTLITFSDLNDPATARAVAPDEFERVFGAGVMFRGATIEMTRDFVTHEIEQKLPFLKPMRDAQKGRSVLRYPDRLNVLPVLFLRS